MIRLIVSMCAAASLVGCAVSPDTTQTDTAQKDTMAAKLQGLEPPIAQRIDKTTTQVGRTRLDPYAWIRDDNWQQVMQEPDVLQPDIRTYLEAENAYTKAALEDPTEALRQTLFDEMKGRIKEDDSSVPLIDGDWAYYRKFVEGGEYAVYARKPAASAFDAESPEEILIDGNALGEDLEYFSFGQVAHSPDHSKMAWTYDDKGSEFYTLKIKDLESGNVLSTVIENTYGSFEWAPDSNSLYWISRNENNRPEKVFHRVLGSSADTEIYHEQDPGYFLGVGSTQSGRFITIRTGDHTTSEYHLIDTTSGDLTTPYVFAPRESGVEYELVDYDGRFYIKTNANGAVDFKIMSAPYTATSRTSWSDVIDHEPGTLITSVMAFKDFLVREERKDGLPRLVIRSRASGEEHAIDFDEAAYDVSATSGYEYGTANLRMFYASPSTPDRTFDYDMKSRERVLRKTREVPSGHNPDDYVVERIMAPSWDGEEIPVTILRLKETPVDGSAPLLLYGYGSYGITIGADFRTSRLSLVDRGFIYAIAHVRGSMTKGYQWYLDGKLDKKTNTFKDYISTGRHLVSNGYGAEGRVIGMGGSAGGLLMGAASNMDPTLFGGIIAAVPFVDVVNTMSDTELPLTPPEWPEWGNPIESAEDYDTIMAYSPYDNVTDLPYPPMLITGGLTDPRVTYWEPAKWAAKLRHEAPNAGPYFLRINMGAGHGGASGRFEGLKETAVEFAFALAAVSKAETLDLNDEK